jgi:hypothetical protein
MTDDRRRSPRVQLLGRLHGTMVSLDVPVDVIEMSLGGMSVETTISFPIGAVHTFSLTLGDGSTVELTGTVRHCRNVAPSDAAPRYVVGFQFVDDGGDIVDSLIGR